MNGLYQSKLGMDSNRGVMLAVWCPCKGACSVGCSGLCAANCHGSCAGNSSYKP